MTARPHIEDKERASPQRAASHRGAHLGASRAEGAPPAGQPQGTEKLDGELRAFEAMKPGALAEYRGRFVAVHRGKVVDSDADDLRLAARIEKRAIREGAIAVCWVGDEGDTETPAPDGIASAFESPLADDLDL